MSEQHKPLWGSRVGVDFDGCIHEYSSGWNGPIPKDKPMPGARDFIRRLQEAGAEVVVITSRAKSDMGAQHIRYWLKNWNFPELAVTREKVACAAYVDDRGVHFSGDWNAAFNSVMQLSRTPKEKSLA